MAPELQSKGELSEKVGNAYTVVTVFGTIIISTPQPLYNTVVGVHSINRVS